jgi:Cu-Zn family superoxide dismutase|tara:strand:- start:190 stop:669 length:480 start_codon:yes stop_codon:yes gene_type:complete
MIVATTLFNHPHIKGTVEFEEKGTKVVIKGELKSTKYKNSSHGIHIHEAGDLSDNCMGACGHFNPYGKKHGGPTSKERHVGDLGNIRFDARGVAKFRMEDNLVKLRGTKANVLGRSLVIHEDMDDLGMGNHSDSLTTGHAGKRITCAVIGYSKRMCTKT